MNLVAWVQRLMSNFGAGWVMWLLLVLSVISVAIMLERGCSTGRFGTTLPSWQLI